MQQSRARAGGSRPRLPDTFASLRHANFRLLWTTSLLNAASSWIQQVTLGWLTYDLTGSALATGVVFGMRSLPSLLIGPIGGVLGDRFERKRGLLINSGYMAALAMFLDTFTAIQQNFQQVFQTLFGGGECQLKLANPDDPLESEIDIHAAPRGKRIQRIHLLSGGERTLVAVSLLFSIYLSKPSPFCLLDEVDAPLDDANVGRFTTLLDEFKGNTQFVVITHNPRTMQAADAVYGVTMQEPGVSTIVGVRLAEQVA